MIWRFIFPKEMWVEAFILDDKVSYFRSNSMKVGDIEKNPSGKKIAEVIGVEFYSLPQSTQDNLYLKTRLLVQVSSKNGDYQFKSKIIKTGTGVQLLLNSASVDGTVLDLGTSIKPRNLEFKTLTLALYSERPWFADSIKVGLGDDNGGGQKLLEVISKSTEPAKMTVTLQNGSTLVAVDPQNVDIILKVRVAVEEIGSRIVFRNNDDLGIGTKISFRVGNVFVDSAFITNIE